MILRPATLADIPLLQHWDTQPHVIAATGSDEPWPWQEMIGQPAIWREVLMATLKGQAIGMVQIIDPLLDDGHYWGDCGAGYRAIDIWIGEAKNIGHGYGTKMMGLALARCFAADEVSAVLIDPLASNHAAIKFYQRLGFGFLERRLFDEDVCAVHQITRAQWRNMD